MRDIIASMGWMSKSLILAVGFGLFPLLFTCFMRRGVRPEVTIFWWMVGTAFGILLLSRSGGHGIVTEHVEEFFVSWKSIFVILFLGATFGVVINTFYGQAVHTAPNPALASAIINSSIIALYLIAWLGYKLLPKIFPPASISWCGLGGVVLTFLGVILIAISRR